jgi:hypothetical protein
VHEGSGEMSSDCIALDRFEAGGYPWTTLKCVHCDGRGYCYHLREDGSRAMEPDWCCSCGGPGIWAAPVPFGLLRRSLYELLGFGE